MPVGRNDFTDQPNNIVGGRNDFVDQSNNIEDGRNDFGGLQNGFALGKMDWRRIRRGKFFNISFLYVAILHGVVLIRQPRLILGAGKDPIWEDSGFQRYGEGGERDAIPNICPPNQPRQDFD